MRSVKYQKTWSFKMEILILHPYVGIIQIRFRVLSQPFRHPVHVFFIIQNTNLSKKRTCNNVKIQNKEILQNVFVDFRNRNLKITSIFRINLHNKPKDLFRFILLEREIRFGPRQASPRANFDCFGHKKTPTLC